jgi:hypothetical protein
MSPARVRLPAQEEGAAPVTILDGEGRVLRIVPAEQFRRSKGGREGATTASWHRRRERAKTDETEHGGTGRRAHESQS